MRVEKLAYLVYKEHRISHANLTGKQHRKLVRFEDLHFNFGSDDKLQGACRFWVGLNWGPKMR